jgi:hypothetical protein
MSLVTSRARAVAVALFVVFVLALNPPVMTAVGDDPLVIGFAPLYLWIVGWGTVGALLIVWAAYRDAFGLSAEQVPPEIETPAGVEDD